MKPVMMTWTEPMRRALGELQQRPLLHRLLAFAQQHGVWLYAVGGTLRDIGVGRSAEDVDLALAGDVLGFAHAFANHLGAAYVPMDIERGEARIVYHQREVIDFARFKGDSIGEDLRHRDFTINAMACPLATLLTDTAPDFVDPHGGWHDLQARIIRMVSDRSFGDDPLRLLRAFRLAASLECRIEPATLAAMEAVTARLVDVAAERIHNELLKLLALPFSSPQVVTMARLGVLDVLFPELAATRGIAMGPDGRQDVFEHSLQTFQTVEEIINAPAPLLPVIADAVVEYVQDEERRALLKWAALLHATGKPLAHRQAAPGHPSALDCAEQSAQHWGQIGIRLKLSRKRIEFIKALILHHRRPFELVSLERQGGLTLRLVHSWWKAVGEDLLAIFVLAIGHALAAERMHPSGRDAAALGQLAAHVWDLYRSRILPVLTAPRLATGHDLQQIFNLTPGPRFKALLDELEVAQVEGRIHTRAEALQWVEAQLR